MFNGIVVRPRLHRPSVAVAVAGSVKLGISSFIARIDGAYVHFTRESRCVGFKATTLLVSRRQPLNAKRGKGRPTITVQLCCWCRTSRLAYVVRAKNIVNEASDRGSLMTASAVHMLAFGVLKPSVLEQMLKT